MPDSLPKIIAVDFDGTCVAHAFPAVGSDIGAPPVLRRLTDAGVRLILHTIRSGPYLEDALRWFGHHNIPLWGVHKNPEQEKWTSSPKAYAEMYIDDAALGVPLVLVPNERPYVDWGAVERMLFDGQVRPQADVRMVAMGCKPDPMKFTITQCLHVGANTIVCARYEGCLTFKGSKLILLRGHHEASELSVLDPHFLDEDHAVIARFVPTAYGLRMAIAAAIEIPTDPTK